MASAPAVSKHSSFCELINRPRHLSDFYEPASAHTHPLDLALPSLTDSACSSRRSSINSPVAASSSSSHRTGVFGFGGTSSATRGLTLHTHAHAYASSHTHEDHTVYPRARFPSFQDGAGPRFPLLDFWANSILMNSAAAASAHSRAEAASNNANRARQQSTAPLKLLTLGDSGAGKSSLLLRYTQDDFSEEFISTIGMDFKVKRTEVGGEPVRVQLWDTAGQERFRSITKNYYQGAHGILLVYDLSRPGGLTSVRKWAIDFEDICVGIDRILIGNKVDLLDRRNGQCEVLEEGKQLAHELGIPFFVTSAKTGEGVEAAFMGLIETVHEKLHESPPSKDSSSPHHHRQHNAQRIDVAASAKRHNGNSGCCS